MLNLKSALLWILFYTSAVGEAFVRDHERLLQATVRNEMNSMNRMGQMRNEEQRMAEQKATQSNNKKSKGQSERSRSNQAIVKDRASPNRADKVEENYEVRQVQHAIKTKKPGMHFPLKGNKTERHLPHRGNKLRLPSRRGHVNMNSPENLHPGYDKMKVNVKKYYQMHKMKNKIDEREHDIVARLSKL
eukprot:GHVH01000072.1.p1 GENE.GHVH01000072.1~~GHVH01000072.1.p1  ORF type:complete len:189 (+),score=19.87 GHVH01000072.1:52-618(+)